MTPQRYKMPDEEMNVLRDKFIYKKQLWNKIQVYASRLGLNNEEKDMNEITRNGIVCVELINRPYGEHDYYEMYIQVINRNEMREVRQRDYKLTTAYYHAHLFYEIPVVNNFNEVQVHKWQEYCLTFLAKQMFLNKRKAEQWLKQKSVNSMFDD